jgi:hypothetical protein
MWSFALGFAMEGKIVGMFLHAFATAALHGQRDIFWQLFCLSIYCEKKLHIFYYFWFLCCVNSFTSIDNFCLEVWQMVGD